MTEQEWLSGADLEPMLRLLGQTCSERKIRLFCCACYWIWCWARNDPLRSPGGATDVSPG